MAKALTKSYKLIDSANAYYGSTHIGYMNLYAKYNSQSVSNNQTYGTAKLTFELISPYTDVSTNNVQTNLVGISKSLGSKTFYRGETTLQEEDFTINHNQDGTSTEKGITGGFSSSVIRAGDVGWTVTAPKIDRYPILTNADNFNDEENPTIQYTTILGFVGATVEACISSEDGSVIYVGYRAVNVDNGSYTFQLTNAERTTLRNATTNANTLPIRFYLRTTTTDNTKYYSYLAKTLTIVNATPTQTTTKLETVPSIVALLGDSATKVVQNASKVRFTITPTAKKGATISSVTITHNGITYTKTASPYTFDIDVKNGNFNVLVTDSRGNKNGTNGETISLTLIEYIPVNITKCDLPRVNPTSSDIVLNLEADYKQTSFNSTTNAPIIKWRFKNGTYATIPSSYYTIDTTNNKVKVNYTISNAVVYTSNAYFDIYIEDKITTDVESDKLVLRGVAVFERGEHDVQVNGNLFVADTNRQNVINVLNTMMTQNAVFDFKVLNINVTDRNNPFPDIVSNIGTLTKTTGFINYSNNSGEDVMIGYLYQGKNNGCMICLSYNYNVAKVYELYNGTYYQKTLLNRYATSEHMVGIWIDGKQLYRKVVTFTGVTTTKKNVNHNISNIDTIVNFDAIGITSDGGAYRLPMVGGTGIFGSIQITTRVNKTAIEISSTNNYNDHTFYFVIYYTKTS